MRNKGLRIAKYTYLETNIIATPTIQKDAKVRSFWSRCYIYGLAMLVLFAMPLYFMGFIDSYIDSSKQFLVSFLSIKSIVVNNNHTISKQEIEDIADLVMPTELYEIDLDEIKKNIERHSYIKKADLNIAAPSQLIINVTERSPSAVWLRQDSYSLIDLDGVVLQNDFAFNDEMGYVTLLGDKANEKWHSLFDELKNHKIYNSIYVAQLISSRRWNLLLKDGLIIKLPEENIKSALNSMQLLLESYKIPDKFSILDLRLAPKKIYGSFD